MSTKKSYIPPSPSAVEAIPADIINEVGSRTNNGAIKGMQVHSIQNSFGLPDWEMSLMTLVFALEFCYTELGVEEGYPYMQAMIGFCERR